MADEGDATGAFGEHARPGLARLLRAVGLDVVYHRAAGDYLYTRSLDPSGAETAVLDLVGGFGTGLFGHHHPGLVEVLCQAVRAGTPFNAQGSVRARAGELASRLSAAVQASTGREYVVTFGSTGADAVEASMKHAVAERNRRLDRLRENLAAALRRVHRDGLADTYLTGSGGATAQLAQVLLDSMRSIAQVRTADPVFVTLAGAFHGKTTGAAALTDGVDAAADLRLQGPRRWCIADWDTADWDTADMLTVLDAERAVVTSVVFDSLGKPHPVESAVSAVAACYVEPIQGEGGVREVDAAVLRGLRALADRHDAALIFDEIQCGMGRTGTFLASEPARVRADHYLLAKALGGGLVKTSAVLVDRDRYVDDVGRHHTSTFADDEISAEVALAALTLLDGPLLTSIAERGRRLRADLESVARRWPTIFGEVRGRGLLLGVDLRPVAFGSRFIRDALGEDTMGYSIAGYLLHRHHIRVLPTLSAPCTLRIEPSAFLDEGAHQRLTVALTDVAQLIASGDVDTLLCHLGRPAGAWIEPNQPHRTVRTAVSPDDAADRTTRTRVAFLANLEGPNTLRLLAPELAGWSDLQCVSALDRMLGEAEPFTVASRVVCSSVGGEVDLDIIGVPFTAAQAHQLIRQGRREWLRHMVLDAVERAVGNGADVVGLGGYTSIVTDSARDVIEDTVRITSGNALTAACAVDFTHSWMSATGPLRRVGIVGALGNIGAVLAELLAEHATAMTLVGRAGSARRLDRHAARLSHLTQVIVSEDLGALRDCDVVITASNAPEPVIEVRHLGSRAPVLIYDIAVPGDVSPMVGQLPNVQWHRGSTMLLPLAQQTHIPGVDLPPGTVHACLAESLVLGFEPGLSNTSLGPLTTTDVHRIRHHAAKHGFVPADHEMERSA